MQLRSSAVALAAVAGASCTGSIFSPYSSPSDGVTIGPDGRPTSTDPSNPSDPTTGTLGGPTLGIAPGWVALLGTTQAPSASFPTELRQSGFSRNDAQIVDDVYATAAQDAATALAAEAI